MDEQKIDRRIRKTKKALLESLTELMSKKKISNITVKELTDLADVNRSTFYLYYKDIFDMVEQIENEMLEEFKKIFEKLRVESSSYTSLLAFFTHIFEYVLNNAAMCKILLTPDNNPAFTDKFKNAIIQTEPPFDKSIPDIKIHYLRPFIISGCIEVIKQWLMDDLNISPKEMAVIITEMIPKSGDTF